MKDLLRILALFRPHWPAMALGGAVSVLTLAAGVTLFALAGRLIASGSDPAASTIVIGGLALSTVLLIRTAAITRSISRYLERLLTHGALFRALSALRIWLFGTLVPLTPGRLATYRSGDVLNRLTRDVDALDSLYLKLLVPSIVAILAAIGLVVVLWPISPAIAAGVLALFAVAGLAVPAIAHRLGRPYAEKTSELTQTLRIRIIDVLQGAPDLLVYRALGREIAAAAEADAELVRSARAARSLGAVTTATTGLVAQLALVLVLLGGHLMTGTEGATGPLVAAAALFVVAIFEAVALLPGAYQTFAETRGAARRLIELSQLPPTIEPATAPQALPADTTLAFNDVRFSYPGADGPVLDHLSFALPPGRRLALVGPSGAGKTTILQLALRFYDPDRGAVLLGGTDLRRLDEQEARSRMALLSQRTEIFHATLGENLRIARPEASNDELRAALEDAGLSALMRRLPAGLDTFLGEQGSMISGGEARRVALARVLLKDAPILLLDEPTEGLDERTEAELIERLVPLTRRKSVLLVSHRRAIAEAMDEVLRIEAGAIRVRGRPQDILSAY